MYTDSLRGRTVVVTGGAGGIGAELCQQLAQLPTDLLVVDGNRDRLDALLGTLAGAGGVVRGVCSTLDDRDACVEVLQGAASELIGLANLAGVFEPDGDDDDAVWARALAHNLTNARTMSLAFAERVPATHTGRIVMTGSMAGNRGAREYVAYSAAKAGLLGLTRALSRRLAPGITVNSVAPGIVLTDMPARVLAKRRAKRLEMIPLRRFGEPRDVAGVIIFLLSDAAAYITGQNINIDGGQING